MHDFLNNATVEELCFLCRPCRDVIIRDKVNSLSSVRESVKRGLEPEVEKSALLEAVAREQLVKT
jgi:hypothetical protein